VEPLSALVARRLHESGRGDLAVAAPRFARFLELVLAANREVNLVSRASASAEELVERHLLDSLEGLPCLPPPRSGLRLVDVGSGAGFPAVPLAIARPDLEVHFVESTGKKCRILERVVAELHLTARVVNARFPAPQMRREQFEILTSRAVADAGTLVRSARSILAPGARALLWTTEPLLAEIRKRSGIQRLDFHKAQGSQVRGVAVLECST
jgi:16S rRNA (guanine527-N7)-methyltransferase